MSLLTAGNIFCIRREQCLEDTGISSVASHHCIRLSHSVIAYGRPSLLVSLTTLCVSSDRKCSRQVEEVDHDGKLTENICSDWKVFCLVSLNKYLDVHSKPAVSKETKKGL